MADAKADRHSKAARPLSPHLQIYRMPVSMVMSIVHRITGGALFFGTLIGVALLVAAATSADAYNWVTGLLGSWLGLLVLIGYTWALLHHLAGGVRHFIWDTGHGYNLETIDLFSWASLAFSLAGTVAIWGYLFAIGGGAP